MWFSVLVRAVLILLPFYTIIGVQAEPQPLIFAHVVGENTPKGKMAVMFKSMVERRLGDHYRVDIYPNTQLMDDDEAPVAIAEGRIHFAAPALSKFEQFTERLKVFDLPFLFADIDAVDKFQQGPIGRELLTHMTGEGILGLGYLHNGMKQLTLATPFDQPEDMAGQRFRSMQSDVLVRQFERLNAEALPMAFSQVYQALADGVVQGQENTWSNIFSQRFYELQPYMMVSNHGVLDYMVITSSEFWRTLPEEHRSYMEYSMEMSIKYGNAVALAKNTNDRIAIERMSNVTVMEPTAEQLRRWQQVMEPIWDEYEAVIGKEVIDAARALQNDR